jgi:hypothetical protein
MEKAETLAAFAAATNPAPAQQNWYDLSYPYTGGPGAGRGKFTNANGCTYEGEMKDGTPEGPGKWTHDDSKQDMSHFIAYMHYGEGVRWSANGQTAWRLHYGQPREEISLTEAAAIAQRIGLLPPFV